MPALHQETVKHTYFFKTKKFFSEVSHSQVVSAITAIMNNKQKSGMAMVLILPIKTGAAVSN